jgi:hypothetical protein
MSSHRQLRRDAPEEGVLGPDAHRGVALRDAYASPLALEFLQRTAGNRAVSAALQRTVARGASLQRCGPIPCECPAEERVAKERAMPPPLAALQRLTACDESGSGCMEVEDASSLPPGYTVTPDSGGDTAGVTTGPESDGSSAGGAAIAGMAASGGPYHPPEGTPMSCSMQDTCPQLSLKINYLNHTIRAHEIWDRQHPDPAYPQGRHFDEIADLRSPASLRKLQEHRHDEVPQPARVGPGS